MKDVYLISGLASDERIFKYLDIKGHTLHFIKWIDPQPDESMQHYAMRLAEQIKTPKPILIGLSFGGMLAIEIAKQIETQKVILISSAKGKKEIPYYYRLAGKTGLHHIMPYGLAKKMRSILYKVFGAHTSEDKKLLATIITDADPKLMKWSVDKVVHWNNTATVKNLVHIHGNNDFTLPGRFVHADKIINNGGHLMVLNRAAEVSDYINETLAEKA